MLQHDLFLFHTPFLSIARKRAHTSESGKCALFLFVWIPVKSFADNMPYILIDGMPSLGIVTVNVLVAADSVIIPSEPDFLSTKGMNLLLKTIGRVHRQINPRLKIDGIVVTKVDSRTNNAKNIIAALRTTLDGSIRVFDTEIPRSVRAAEASGEGKSIFAFDPKGRVAQAYGNLTKEVAELGKEANRSRSDGAR